MTRRIHGNAWDPFLRFLRERATGPLATSTLGFAETVRTLDLMGHFPKAMEDLDAGITEILLTREVRDAAAVPAGRLRTPDAVRVAGALSLRDGLTAPVTCDRRMLETPRAGGPPARAPGTADRPGVRTVGTRQEAAGATVGAPMSRAGPGPIGFRGSRLPSTGPGGCVKTVIERVIR